MNVFRIVLVVVGKADEGDAKLPQVTFAGRAACGGFRASERGQEQRRQNGDDGNNHQQLDQRKRGDDMPERKAGGTLVLPVLHTKRRIPGTRTPSKPATIMRIANIIRPQRSHRCRR